MNRTIRIGSLIALLAATAALQATHTWTLSGQAQAGKSLAQPEAEALKARAEGVRAVLGCQQP